MEGAPHAPAQAAAPSVPGRPSVPQWQQSLPRCQPRQGRGRAEVAQPGWDSPGSSPAAAPHLSAPGGCTALHIPQPQPPSPRRPPRSRPRLLQRRPAVLGWAWPAPPGAPSRQPARPSPSFLAPCQAGGNRKPQSSCSQLLRHIWIAMRALLLLLLLLFTLCRHVGFLTSSFPSPFSL